VKPRMSDVVGISMFMARGQAALPRRAFSATVMALMLIATMLPEAVAATIDLPRRPFLGIAMQAVDDPGARVKVDQVIEGSSAALADVRPGDLIVAIDGNGVSDPADMVARVKQRRAGDEIRLDILRDGSALAKSIPLVGLPLEQAGDYETVYDAVLVDGHKRRTIVTRPIGTGPYPAVLFVGGIGCYSMEAPFDNKEVYRQLMGALTRTGFATMRVEKSGMGDSEGPACSDVDLDAEISGYRAGLEALANRRDVNPDRLFIVGHSIGGIVGPLVAAKTRVRGLVAMATIGTTWFEYELVNRRRQLKLAGMEPRSIGRQMQLKQWCMHRLLIEKQPRTEILAERPECDVEMQIPVSDAYLQQVASIDLPEIWAKLASTDILLLYGASDYLTSADEHREIVEVVNAVRPGAATFVEIAGLDHYMTQAPSQAESFKRKRLDETGPFHEGLPAAIGDWLRVRATTPANDN